MWRLLRYYGNYQGFRSSMDRMPHWARLMVAIAALPGLLLIALSILALCVSVLTLLLLSVPVYRLLKAVTGVSDAGWMGDMPPSQDLGVDAGVSGMGDPGQAAPPRRHVDVKIVE